MGDFRWAIVRRLLATTLTVLLFALAVWGYRLLSTG